MNRLLCALDSVDPVALTTVLQTVAKGTWLGVGAAMPLGPVNVEIAKRVLRFGFRAGVALGMGAVTVDVAYAVLSAWGGAQVLNTPAVMVPAAAIGAAFLGYLGVQSLRAAARHLRRDLLPIDAADSGSIPSSTAPADGRNGELPTGDVPLHPLRYAYVAGLLMTLLNPMTLAFWLSVVAAAGSGSAVDAPVDAPLPFLLAGVFVGTSAWVLGYSSVLAVAARRTSTGPDRGRRRVTAAVDVVGGLTLLGFAVAAALRLLRSIP